MPGSMLRRAAWISLAAEVFACTGTIDESGVFDTARVMPGDATRPAAPGASGAAGAMDPAAGADPAPAATACSGDGALSPGRAPLRRLTVTEYDNTVRDLLGDTTAPASRFVDDERGVLSADDRIVTALLAEQYMQAAEDVAARLTSEGELDRLLACDRAAVGDDGCALQLIERIAPRAYRRPVEDSEIEALVALYEAGRDDGGFAVGIQLVLETVLQSPSFLYRIETVPASGARVVRLGGYELATRLSYFLVGTMPDDELRAAAAAGELDTDEGIETQARRLLERADAHQAIQRFFADYLDLEQLEGLEKDPEIFPDYHEAIPQLFRRETEEFVRSVVIDGDGSWVTLLTAPWSMMNAELAAFHGVDGPTGDAFERVELDPRFHAGLLTQASVTAPRARTYETSPVHRGMFVRGTLLCGVVPNVPEGLEVTLPEPDPTLTTRERFARHRSDRACAACHAQLDPLGFAFENFDAAGRFRATENGIDIDASGMLVDTDVDGSFEGAVDLARMITQSPRSHSCFVERWFPAAFGRTDERDDECTLETSVARFAESGFDIRELGIAIVLSDAFLHRVADQDALTEVSP